MWKNCRICPRECGADRTAAGMGYCKVPAQVILARAALHAWEEPCISGNAGSGAVFFSGCSLGCIYCQNVEISGGRLRQGGAESRVPLPGIRVSTEELADILLRLQDTEHANNINLVTASHYIPQTASALTIAKKRGLKIPVIYNSGGYEKISSLKMLEGLVDVYLPDFKYMLPQTARAYSHAADYPDIAKAAIAEMVRQAGEPAFYPEQPRRAAEPAICSGDPRPDHPSGKQECPKKEGRPLLIKKGVIVRHLLLPGHVAEAKKIIAYLHDTYGERIYLSILNQYTPMPQVCGHPLLGRRTTRREYERLVDYAIEIGVEYGFIQEGGTQKESFIPAWNGKGILPKSGGAGIFPE